uniref:Uncharacterized protein n=1 Tax=Trichuris muris TaxID=70415 RepID=A0A5S6QMF9_TRIMR
MVRERPQRLDNGIVASYKVSKIIAKSGNAHSIGESLILPAVSIIIFDVMKLAPEETVQAIPLSNSTVCMRIDEMAADIFQKLNLLNKALQGKDSDLISSKSELLSFVKKLELYLHNLGRREFSQFPNLKAIAGILKDEDLLAYVSHLKQVSEDMKERFCYLLNLYIPSWILDPFEVPAVEAHPEIEEELMEAT